MKNQFLDSIKESLLSIDKDEDKESYYDIYQYKKIEYYDDNKLFIELNYDNNDNIYNSFILLYDEYNIYIYDYENFENDFSDNNYRFSLNHIQFENDKNNYIISKMIDEFFRFFENYLEYKDEIN